MIVIPYGLYLYLCRVVLLVLFFSLLITCISRLESLERMIRRKESLPPVGQHQPYVAWQAVFKLDNHSSKFGDRQIAYGPRAIRFSLHNPFQTASSIRKQRSLCAFLTCPYAQKLDIAYHPPDTQMRNYLDSVSSNLHGQARHLRLRRHGFG